MIVDELDMSVEWKWHAETWSHRVIESLKKNNVEAQYAADRKEALAMVKKAIPKGATIGIGDSLTLHEIGLFDWLEKQPGRTVFNPFVKDAEGYNVYKPLERFEMMRKAMTSDVFLASSNAVTLDGKLVNVDGRGNRVAAMIFGPKRTILVIGANKIVRNVDEGLERIKSICAPVNARRHALKHHNEAFGKLPCCHTGVLRGLPWRCQNVPQDCHHRRNVEAAGVAAARRLRDARDNGGRVPGHLRGPPRGKRPLCHSGEACPVLRYGSRNPVRGLWS